MENFEFSKNPNLGIDLATNGLNSNSLSFHVGEISEPILVLKSNGDILVKGKLIENDKEVVDALRMFVEKNNLL